MHLLLTFPYLTISLHPGPQPVLELQWLRYAGSTDLREALTQALRLSREHQVSAWLTDDRQQGAIRPRDLEWAEQEIMLPLSTMGLARFAQLESLDAMHRRTVAAMYARALPNVHFAFQRFEDLMQARAWAGGADA